MQTVIDDYEVASSRCESFASSSSVDKENRFVDNILEELSAVNNTQKFTHPIWVLDNENASTSGISGYHESRNYMDIDERSLDNASQRDFDIDESMEGVVVDESVEGVVAMSSSPTDATNVCEFNDKSQKSPERGNYVLPALSNDCRPFPEPSTSRMVDLKSKKRKLGPLSSELLQRIRAQKYTKTMAKFRACLTEEKQIEEGAPAEFSEGNIVASAWGVDMIGSLENVKRFIFRKTENNK